VFHIRSKKEKIPRFAIRSFNLLDNTVASLPGLSVKYKGKKLDSLTATKICFWNAGSATINSQDIASADPMRIILPKGRKFLFGRVGSQSIAGNNVTVNLSEDNNLTMTFDYLDKNQGAVILILHTGSSKEIIVQRSIKGAFPLSTNTIWPWKWPKNILYLISILLLLFLPMLGLSIFHGFLLLLLWMTFFIFVDEKLCDEKKVPRSLKDFGDMFSENQFV
jgi:hypothetical protein